MVSPPQACRLPSSFVFTKHVKLLRGGLRRLRNRPKDEQYIGSYGGDFKELVVQCTDASSQAPTMLPGRARASWTRLRFDADGGLVRVERQAPGRLPGAGASQADRWQPFAIPAGKLPCTLWFLPDF
jgi:hypothetical protein